MIFQYRSLSNSETKGKFKVKSMGAQQEISLFLESFACLEEITSSNQERINHSNFFKHGTDGLEQTIMIKLK